jgi:hypothetical protein
MLLWQSLTKTSHPEQAQPPPECPLKLSLPHSRLTPFYALRDLLNKSPQGQQLVTTYY